MTIMSVIAGLPLKVTSFCNSSYYLNIEGTWTSLISSALNSLPLDKIPDMMPYPAQIQRSVMLQAHDDGGLVAMTPLFLYNSPDWNSLGGISPGGNSPKTVSTLTMMMSGFSNFLVWK